MNVLLASITALLLVLLLQKTGIAFAEMSCKSLQSDITKKQLQGMSYCAKKLKYKGKEKAKKMNCIIRCVMMKESFLDEEGQTSPDTFKNYTQIFPPKIREHFNSTMWDCMELAFVGFQSPEEDPYCSSYDSFLKCMIGKTPTMCQGMD